MPRRSLLIAVELAVAAVLLVLLAFTVPGCAPLSPKPPVVSDPSPVAVPLAFTVIGPDGTLPAGATLRLTTDDPRFTGPYTSDVLGGRLLITIPAGVHLGWQTHLHVTAPGLTEWAGAANVNPTGEGCPCVPAGAGGPVDTIQMVSALPPVPTREQVMLGQVSMYGTVCDVPELGGLVPWWDGGLQALSADGRERVYRCKLARGDTAAIVEAGELDTIVYNEPGNPYQIPLHPFDVAARVVEALQRGFQSVHLFLDGDGGGGNIALANDEFERVHQKLLHGGPNGEDLNPYTVVLPTWDGGFYVWPDEDMMAWAAAARAICPTCILGLEVPTGHIPFGEGGDDYRPGGRMHDFDYLPIELSIDTVHDNNTYGIVERLIGPAYVRPSDDVPPNDGGDNHPRPWYPASPNPRGPWGVACFEPPTYRWVRVGVPVPPEAITLANANRLYLKTLGCPVVD